MLRSTCTWTNEVTVKEAAVPIIDQNLCDARENSYPADIHMKALSVAEHAPDAGNLTYLACWRG